MFDFCAINTRIIKHRLPHPAKRKTRREAARLFSNGDSRPRTTSAQITTQKKTPTRSVDHRASGSRKHERPDCPHNNQAFLWFCTKFFARTPFSLTRKTVPLFYLTTSLLTLSKHAGEGKRFPEEARFFRGFTFTREKAGKGRGANEP